jgi:hypothetical protein
MYRGHAAAKFEHFPRLDGMGAARFANEEQMNVQLLEVKPQ